MQVRGHDGAAGKCGTASESNRLTEFLVGSPTPKELLTM